MSMTYHRLKEGLQCPGYLEILEGTIVRVIDATNQPEWKNKGLVFVRPLSRNHLSPEILIPRNELKVEDIGK